jgi:hypothetical protein
MLSFFNEKMTGPPLLRVAVAADAEIGMERNSTWNSVGASRW